MDPLPEELEDFGKKIFSLQASDQDREWVCIEGWDTLQALRKEVDPYSKLRLEQMWAEALFRVARSLSSEEAFPSIWSYHIHLVHALGRTGAKLLRLHRQSHLLTIPWMDNRFVEFARISSPRLQDSRPSPARLDRFWSNYISANVARQLLTVFASDYRAEQQKDFSGQVSLSRPIALGLERDIMFASFQEAFLGREEWLFSLERMHNNSSWQELSSWLHLAARNYCRDFEAFCEADLGQSLWMAGQKRDVSFASMY